MIWTLLLLTAAVLCFAIRELYYHRKLKWIGSFWDEHSWENKYGSDDEGHILPAPKTWYYKFNDLKYKEKFPLSGTLLVWTTDCPHLFQFLFKIFLAISFVPLAGWIWAGVIWATWGLSFTIFYKLLSR